MHNSGLKPWAVLYSRFAAKSDSPLLDKQPDSLLLTRVWVAKCPLRGTAALLNRKDSERDLTHF
jgi:hypothetical protein